MQELSVQANKYLADYVNFSGIKHVVDLGGGDGKLSIGVVEMAELAGDSFDSPTGCEIAKEQ